MKVKVKLCAWWSTPEKITKRLFDQFYTGKEQIDKVEFVYDDTYDYIFFCNYENEPIKNGCKGSYIFIMEPSWSGNLQKHNTGVHSTIYGQDKRIFTDPSKVIEQPLYMFYGGRGEDTWTYTNIVNKQYQKNKNISSIVSCMNGNRGGNCMYDQRYGFIKQVLDANLKVDVYGWEHINSKGGLREKIDGLKDYRFSLAIENCQEQNYITEKFYDCIITDTVPIYFGAPNIKDIFPQNGYFNLSNINDLNELTSFIDTINNNAETIYNYMLPELHKIKSYYLNQLNPLNKIIELVAIN